MNDQGRKIRIAARDRRRTPDAERLVETLTELGVPWTRGRDRRSQCEYVRICGTNIIFEFNRKGAVRTVSD